MKSMSTIAVGSCLGFRFITIRLFICISSTTATAAWSCFEFEDNTAVLSHQLEKELEITAERFKNESRSFGGSLAPADAHVSDALVHVRSSPLSSVEAEVAVHAGRLAVTRADVDAAAARLEVEASYRSFGDAVARLRECTAAAATLNLNQKQKQELVQLEIQQAALDRQINENQEWLRSLQANTSAALEIAIHVFLLQLRFY